MCLHNFYSTCTYLRAQGYPVDQNLFYQDNMANMRIEVNGYYSRSKITKHIKSKFFFIKFKVEDRDIEVRYCSTEKIWSDVLNKPKQGTYFRLNHSNLQNVPVEYDNVVNRKWTYPLILPKV